MELKGPSEAEIKKIIKLETRVEFVTLTNQHFKGVLLWADGSAFHLKLENEMNIEKERTITILKNAVAYYSAI
jgi:hypothetical protein